MENWQLEELTIGGRHARPLEAARGDVVWLRLPVIDLILVCTWRSSTGHREDGRDSRYLEGRGKS